MRATPNPNVLVELGYAAHSLGWDRIIVVVNTAHGAIEELPFDFRARIVESCWGAGQGHEVQRPARREAVRTRRVTKP